MKEIKESELRKDYLVETERGNKFKFETWLFDRYYTIFLVGLFIGIIGISAIFLFQPLAVPTIATQICNQYSGTVMSYKYNYFAMNFESLVCKVSNRLIQVI